MTRFFSGKYAALEPYTPGEQPKDMKYIKLNTNESPYQPPKSVVDAADEAAKNLQLYSDPDCKKLSDEFCKLFGVNADQVLFTNGSDEALNFAFMAFCDGENKAAFPDITYGFYPVFAQLNFIDFEEIPLKADFSVCADDYVGINKTIFIANPNAPTGLTLSLGEIEKILSSNPNNVVVIDEAYVDFGGESATKLIDKYDNLLVIGTFSKSRSLAGARLGYAVSNKDIIADLNTVKYSTNPYNVNSVTIAAGAQALKENEYFMDNCRKIQTTRAWTKARLEELGFYVLDSRANFLFAKSNRIGGEELYLKLKSMGILIRHFSKERIKDFLRITIGTPEQMESFIEATEKIIK